MFDVGSKVVVVKSLEKKSLLKRGSLGYISFVGDPQAVGKPGHQIHFIRMLATIFFTRFGLSSKVRCERKETILLIPLINPLYFQKLSPQQTEDALNNFFESKVKDSYRTILTIPEGYHKKHLKELRRRPLLIVAPFLGINRINILENEKEGRAFFLSAISARLFTSLYRQHPVEFLIDRLKTNPTALMWALHSTPSNGQQRRDLLTGLQQNLERKREVLLLLRKLLFLYNSNVKMQSKMFISKTHMLNSIYKSEILSGYFSPTFSREMLKGKLNIITDPQLASAIDARNILLSKTKLILS